MAVSLTKGQRVSLEKISPGLSEVSIGLGWDVKATDTGLDFDLDSALFLLGANEKLISDNHFIFYQKDGFKAPSFKTAFLDSEYRD